MKKEKGFTLVELLSVVAVLAVIALIILPVVTNVIEKSKREAFKDSVLHGMKSISSELAANDFEDFPINGVKANDTKMGLDKNRFISGVFKHKYNNDEDDLYAFKVTDGRYCATGYKVDLEVVLGPCYLLDKTAPEVNLVAGVITSRSIQVVANAKDEESDIVSYEFSKDNGKTWTNKQTTNSYNFDMLAKNTSFTIKARVTNENSLVTEKSITLKTNNINVPTYTSNPALTSWSRSKVVTITYPARQTYFIYEYSTNGGSSWNTVTSGTTQNVTFNSNGTLIARVRDGYNTVTASTLTITTIDTSAPGIPSATVRYDSNSGTVRGNSSAWTNRTLWWGNYTATDTGGSGINHYEYSDGCTGSSSGTLSSSGHTYTSNKNTTYCIRAVDNAGNVGGWSGAYYFRVDKTAPTCVSSGGGGWTASNLTISGRCSSDTGGSGCSTTAPSRTFTSTTSGSYSPGNITDIAGNTTACPAVGVYIDKTAPSVPVNNTNGYNGNWTNGNVTISSTASDSHSGMARIEYSYDKVNIIQYAASEIINAGSVKGIWSASRNNTVYMRAVDKVGNVSAWSSGIVVKIDKIAPTCTSDGGGGWTKGNRTITGTCSDTGGSGCTGGVTTTYTYETNGQYSPGTVRDSAGNATSCPTQQVSIDRTAPSIASAPSVTPAGGYIFAVAPRVVDWGSGYVSFAYTYRYANGSGSSANVSRGGIQDGTEQLNFAVRSFPVSVSYTICDAVGNCSYSSASYSP